MLSIFLPFFTFYAVRPSTMCLSHRLDTSSRVERPNHDWGCESAAQVRQLEASGQGTVGSMRMHGIEQKR